MHVSEIQQAVQRQPFQPFTLRLKNGREYYIPYADLLSISCRRLLVVLGEGRAEAVAYMEASQIESIKSSEVHMVLEAVRQAIRRQPFRPFTLRLADGRELFVPHPEFIAISGRTVIVTNAMDEVYSIIEPLLIVSIDYLEGAPEAAGGANEEGSNA